MERLKSIEKKLNYIFKDKDYLSSAITHPSFLNETEKKPKYLFRNLEYVGDAVLEIVIRKYLFLKDKNIDVKILFKNKIKIVNNKMLARLFKELQLESLIQLGMGEKKKKNAEVSVIADIFEAILGAMYLDSNKISVIESFLFSKFNDMVSRELELKN